jgi:hypothetical protein
MIVISSGARNLSLADPRREDDSWIVMPGFLPLVFFFQIEYHHLRHSG